MFTAIASYPVDPRLDYIEILRDGIVHIYEILSGCPKADDMRGHTPGEAGLFIHRIAHKQLDPGDPRVTEAMLTENHTAITHGPVQSEEAAQEILETIQAENQKFIIG